MLTQENNQTQLNNTLNVLLTELGEECSTVLTLLNQLKLANLSIDQKGRANAQIWALIITVIGATIAAIVKFGFLTKT